MVSLITPSTVCKKLKIELLALSLIVFVHHTSLRFLNICIGYLLTVNYRINYKICCIIHRALSLHKPHYHSSLFSLRSNSHSFHSSSLAHYYYHSSIKNQKVFVCFHLLHHISRITNLIFVLHQPICR